MKYWRTPLEVEKVAVPHGELHILRERCKGCAFCVEYCPVNVLELSPEFNKKGYHPPRTLNGAGCVHCQLCEAICPDFAIFCVLVEEEQE